MSTEDSQENKSNKRESAEPQRGRHRQRTKFISFLKKHDNGLKLLGTIIVFVTFVTKEILQEAARDKREAYETAQVLLGQNYNFIDLDDKIRHINFLVLTLTPESENPGKWKQARWENNHDRIDQLRRLLELIDKISATLPSGHVEDLAKRVSDLKARIPSLKQELSDTNETSADSEWDKLTSKVFSDLKAARDLFPSLLDKLEQEAEVANRNYIIFGWCSWGLYTLGFLVAVLGQLLGIETKAED